VRPVILHDPEPHRVDIEVTSARPRTGLKLDAADPPLMVVRPMSRLPLLNHPRRSKHLSRGGGDQFGMNRGRGHGLQKYSRKAGRQKRYSSEFSLPLKISETTLFSRLTNKSWDGCWQDRNDFPNIRVPLPSYRGVILAIAPPATATVPAVAPTRAAANSAARKEGQKNHQSHQKQSQSQHIRTSKCHNTIASVRLGMDKIPGITNVERKGQLILFSSEGKDEIALNSRCSAAQ
jgi:hypothetical protein